MGRCKQRQRGLRGYYVAGLPLLNARCTSLLSEMTYTVSSGTLNSSIPYDTIRRTFSVNRYAFTVSMVLLSVLRLTLLRCGLLHTGELIPVCTTRILCMFCAVFICPFVCCAFHCQFSCSRPIGMTRFRNHPVTGVLRPAVFSACSLALFALYFSYIPSRNPECQNVGYISDKVNFAFIVTFKQSSKHIDLSVHLKCA